MYPAVNSYSPPQGFLLGLSIPIHWKSKLRSGKLALVLMRYAIDLGFDFLLVPESLIRVFTLADTTAPLVPRLAFQKTLYHHRADGRYLIWLRQTEKIATRGFVVSINEHDLHLQQVSSLKEQLAAIHPGIEDNKAGCALLEVKIEGSFMETINDEDDVLESFATSLGGKHISEQRDNLLCATKLIVNGDSASQLLSLAQDLGFDGLSLAMPNFLDYIRHVDNSTAFQMDV